MTTPTGVVLQQSFEESNSKVMLKKSHAKFIKLVLRKIILMDRQSNMDLFCNPKLVENVYKSKKNIHLRSNVVKMLITHRSQVSVYKPHFWFDQKSITNLIAHKNLIKQYRVTYDR